MHVLKVAGKPDPVRRVRRLPTRRFAGCGPRQVPVHFRLARLDTGRGSVLNSDPVLTVLEGVHPLLIIGRDVDMGRGGTQGLMEGTKGAGWKG